jgi:hypothetical protein
MTPTILGTCYVQGTHPYSFRPDEPAAILRVVMVQPLPTKDRTYEPRACFEILFHSDNFIDYIPLAELNLSYKIISDREAMPLVEKQLVKVATAN